MTFALPLSLFIAMAQTPASRLSSGFSLGLVLTLFMLILFAVTAFLNRRAFARNISETTVQSLNVALPNYAAVGTPLLGTTIGPDSGTTYQTAY